MIAALLPMAFVSGLMGPYMSPIPINASMGMLLSLAIAFIVTPWLARTVADSRGTPAAHAQPRPRRDARRAASSALFAPLLDDARGGATARAARRGRRGR